MSWIYSMSDKDVLGVEDIGAIHQISKMDLRGRNFRRMLHLKGKESIALDDKLHIYPVKVEYLTVAEAKAIKKKADWVDGEFVYPESLYP